jgi:uncharacterized protein YbjT (DUF2867 family)
MCSPQLYTVVLCWLSLVSPSFQVTTADPQAAVFYSRSKGLTEQALAELGYKDTIIFRPSVLSNVQRPELRPAEIAVRYVSTSCALSVYSQQVGCAALTSAKLQNHHSRTVVV